MNIRNASPDDAEEILRIYAPYVLETAVSFEYTVPSVDEFRKRIENTLSEYPYLVALDNGKIVGYAYASAFHPREAYKHSAELSIYIEKNYQCKGTGRILYAKLEEILLQQNVFRVHACIAVPDKDDEYLTHGSEIFHSKMGFFTAGRHEKCGYKFGRWYSMIWMEKEIRERIENPERFIPFSDIQNKLFNL